MYEEMQDNEEVANLVEDRDSLVDPDFLDICVGRRATLVLRWKVGPV